MDRLKPAGADRGTHLDDLLDPIVRDLAALPGMVAVALGGSHASGTAHPDSDVDLGLYYREAAPFDVARLRILAARINDTPDPKVTEFGGWGKWPNGGAWLTVRGRRVDFIYRSVERLQHWIDESRKGEFTQDYYVQDAFGFRSYMYLGELTICIPLHDPDGVLAALKAQVTTYPPALKRELIRTWLPIADNFYTMRKAASRGDVYMTVGCMTRHLSLVAQVLFALNERYFVTDKGTLEQIDTFALKPAGFTATVRAVLAAPGRTPEELGQTVDRLERVYQELNALCRVREPGVFVEEAETSTQGRPTT